MCISLIGLFSIHSIGVRATCAVDSVQFVRSKLVGRRVEVVPPITVLAPDFEDMVGASGLLGRPIALRTGVA